MEQTFKERLRSLLDNKGLYVKELAAKTNMSKRSIDNYLGGQTSMPPADVAVRIAKALDTTVEYLVTGIKSPSGIVIAPEDIELIKKIHLLDDIDKKVVEDLIQSFIDRKRSEVSAMETSRIG
ncbi:helix-turn-helix domain-containing protein [Treponema denticola]|jgi:bacteriophage CI repressor helix-turn-helix domain|uniref:helix-turn-helix domain-containing protein n=1 Tax=Treponema denticola TaxID=158 RepID=UPI0020A2B39E|nr:helix-turn-helix transcriptional regulator [Treponema denticola]UTC88041.1 helix-turn-helix transcriptional regulator [Treponema denticola]